MNQPSPSEPRSANSSPGGLLAWFERIGNRLPDPALLFVGATVLVFLASLLLSVGNWQVPKLVAEQSENGLSFVPSGEKLTATNLVSSSGLFWLLSTMADNFINFAPLKVILVGMMGVGLAERSGLIRACLRAGGVNLPRSVLTPALIFLGVMSSVGLDAGYIVLPPLAVALFRAHGLAPQVGVFAVFAGISAGFCANLFPTALDPMLAEFTQTGAAIIQPGYQVNALCNWFFAIASTVLLVLVGWWVSHKFIAPRYAVHGGRTLAASATAPSSAAAGEADSMHQKLSQGEFRALLWAGITAVLVTAAFALMMVIPNAPLDFRQPLIAANANTIPRYTKVIVPCIAALFAFPALVYGHLTSTMRGAAAVFTALSDTMKAMAPIIVLAFFAAQFVESFKQSGLDEMIAFAGGSALAESQLPVWLLLLLFVLLVMVLNLFIGSMSAKYTMLAPIVVPMLMLVGISPELTQAAYRIGDSTSNILTPLNSYFIVILAALRQADPKAGLGTIMANMLPYSLFFTLAWLLLLGAWIGFGWPLGLDGELWLDPAEALATEAAGNEAVESSD